jgi:hypothetical protein
MKPIERRFEDRFSEDNRIEAFGGLSVNYRRLGFPKTPRIKKLCYGHKSYPGKEYSPHLLADGLASF